MKDNTATAVTVRVDQIGDRRFDAGLAQRLDDEAALPRPVSRRLPMLHGAAAANTEMRTNRRDALRARCLDAKKLAAVGMAGYFVNFNGLARQGSRHKDRPVSAVGDAIAAMADPVDDEMLNHVRPR
jgi:hypothetical protein